MLKNITSSKYKPFELYFISCFPSSKSIQIQVFQSNLKRSSHFNCTFCLKFWWLQIPVFLH